MKKLNWRSLGAALVLVVLLVGCGGGSGPSKKGKEDNLSISKIPTDLGIKRPASLK